MKSCVGFGVGLVLFASAVARAQSTPISMYDNVHLRVSDPAKAVSWYIKQLGAASALAEGRVLFGKTRIVFVKSEPGPPSAGSVIDHLGLSFRNAEATVKRLEAAGAKVVSAPRDIHGMSKAAFVEDPWGVKLEILQDGDLLGFHHVHLRVSDPAATLAWYHDLFGGERTKLKHQLEGLRYGAVWLFAESSGSTPLARSTGRAIENIAWQVQSIERAAEKLRIKGVKFLTEPRAIKDPYGSSTPLWYTMVEDPNGVRVEVLQRPTS